MSDWLTHHRLRGLKLGSAAWFKAQRELIREKPLIRRCYDLWYQRLLADCDSVPGAGGLIVELGSGSGDIKRVRPEAVTSDVMPGVVDLVFDGRYLPFRDSSVRALLLTHVFHHVPDVAMFLEEARRVLVPGGVISMVDVTHTPFGKLFFSRVHPEPYDDDATSWSFPEGDSILDSNQALTWMVFTRDRAKFERLFPDLRLERREYLPWLSYLLSGGVNLRSFVPGFLAPLFVALDWILKPLDGIFAVHWHLTVRKTGSLLEREAAAIHERFFGGPAPPEVVTRYVDAHREYHAESDDPHLRTMRIVLERGLDIEAVELALRLNRRDRFLTSKIQVLFCLVEVRSKYYGRFVNMERRRARAWWEIGMAVLRTAWKYAKGVWLVQRYGL